MQEPQAFKETDAIPLGVLYRLAEHGRVLGPGVHIGHINTLLVLASSGGMTITELAKTAEMTVAAASRHIRRLKVAPEGDPVRQGFVQVARASDARMKRVRLTPRGLTWVLEATALLAAAERPAEHAGELH